MRAVGTVETDLQLSHSPFKLAQEEHQNSPDVYVQILR